MDEVRVLRDHLVGHNVDRALFLGVFKEGFQHGHRVLDKLLLGRLSKLWLVKQGLQSSEALGCELFIDALLLVHKKSGGALVDQSEELYDALLEFRVSLI